MKVEQNISRLKYLLTLYKMTVEDLLLSASEGLNKPLTKDDILSNEIKVSHLKRIDKVFNKGLHYYLDPKFPEVSKDASIFFRKNKFGTELTIGAKKIVNQFEEFKISLSAISKLADINIDRSLPVFSVQDDPKVVAIKIRKELYPDFNPVPKEFLRALISKFAELRKQQTFSHLKMVQRLCILFLSRRSKARPLLVIIKRLSTNIKHLESWSRVIFIFLLTARVKHTFEFNGKI